MPSSSPSRRLIHLPGTCPGGWNLAGDVCCVSNQGGAAIVAERPLKGLLATLLASLYLKTAKMAYRLSAIFVLFSIVVVQLEASSISADSACKTGYECFHLGAAEYNRKMLMHLVRGSQEVVKGRLGHGSSSRGGEEETLIDGDELRRAPSGPDPMHHNGGSPQKPIKTSP
ncbi:hypothetical protein Nepgr_014526 [Nepenthes gracilis]|uniref:Uncharacterized protein n=1 Tax=Nepenthes gracilis TaxID=150966 RepID=A0AAD3SL05_NEPGR|nr:hypothetical protein Nepgr_014526 [Nepenthes gracilis]